MLKLLLVLEELFTFQKKFGADNSEILLSWFLLILAITCIGLVRKNSVSVYWASFICVECLILVTAVWFYTHTVEPFPRGTCGIYIARFQGDNGTKYRDEIYRTLKRSIHNTNLGKKVTIKQLPCQIWGKRGNAKARYWGTKGNAKIVIWGSFSSKFKIWSWITVVNPQLVGEEPLTMGPTSGIVLERAPSEVALPEELVEQPILLTNLVLSSALIHQGRYHKAIKKLNKVVERNPDFFAAYFYLGEAYYEMSDYSSSIKMYNKTIKLKPDYFSAYLYLGASYYREKCFEESIETLKRAKEIKPHRALVYHNMGVVYYGMGKFQDSLGAYAKAAELQPGDPNTRNGLISACVAVGEPDKAIRIWKDTTHVNPDFLFYLILSLSSMEAGELTQAENFIQTSLRQKDDYVRLHIVLAMIYFKQGRLKDGLEIYLKYKTNNFDYALIIFKECRKVIKTDEELARKLRKQIPDLEGELKELAEKFLSERKG